jgi:NAD(P)-dependent dehydrogenase (short-subunit alcohol dehydrogenase family)
MREETTMSKLEGKVAVVTGAAMTSEGDVNIGGASAIALAEAGAAVLVGDIDHEGAQRLAQHLRELDRQALARALDVTVESDVEALLQAAVDDLGGLDVLHNNVGIGVPADKDVASLDTAIWDRLMAINARSVMLGCKHAVPHMIRRGGGSIVNTTSGAGHAGDIVRTTYGSTKAAVSTLTKYVAVAHGKQGIRCNAVLPGLILSSHVRSSLSQEWLDMNLRYNLVPRHGEPEDVAHAVVFLASDDASFITGQILAIDGGVNVQRPYTMQSREEGVSSDT